jgi:chemotaxis protein MotB
MDELRDYGSETEETKIWTTVYSDMVTNLMLFFLMLYALTRMSAEMREGIIKGMEGRFSGVSDARVRAEKVVKEFREEDAADRVSALIQKQGIEDYTTLAIDEKHIRMTLNMPVLFDSGSARLGEQAKAVLSDVSKIIASVPNKVIVEGHTDDRPVGKGLYDSNWELSVARSAGVIDFFSSSRGIPSERFIAAGYGEFKPVEMNDTFEGRSKNRRIEIVLVRR